MKKLTIFWVVLSLAGCTTVNLVRHPDFNFPPTNPKWVAIYQGGMLPTYDFVIIGAMTIDTTWSLSAKDQIDPIQKKAALIGGNGVIITDKRIDIYAFNRGTKTQGSATAWGNQVYYSETTRDTTTYIPKITWFAYVVRRIK